MYGQSLFETVAVSQHKPCLLDQHLQRLQQGCQILGIQFDEDQLSSEITVAIERAPEKSVLRIAITMGEGGRGYKNPESPEPTRILSLHDYPSYPQSYYLQGVELGVADIRLASQPVLAGIKHSNRLEQIIARSQWQDNWQEALLLDTAGDVIEATQSNVFIVKDTIIKTPDLNLAGVAGVMRDFILSKANEIGVSCEIMRLSLTDIEQADEVFVSNSIIGLWPVKRFQTTQYSNFTFSNKLLTVMQGHGAIPNI